MPILINEEKQQFHLTNNKISYIIHILPNKHVGHLYFGKALRHRDDFGHLFRMKQRALSQYPIKDLRGFSLDTTKQEYPSYGTSDFREGCIELLQENGSTITDFKYKGYKTYKGKPKLMNGKLPATYIDNEEDATTLEIELEDTLINTKIRLLYTLLENEAVITRSALIINSGDEVLFLNRAMSMGIDFDDSNYKMLQLSGAWSRERHVITRDLAQGIQSISSSRGASSAHQNPFLALLRDNANEHTGEAYGFSLVYSGNFLAQVEVNHDNQSRVILGINPLNFSWRLSKGDSFQTPEVVLVYSDKGINGMSQTYHRTYRNHLIPKPWNKQLAPVLINNWEATYFNFNEDKILQLAKEAVGLGIDLFVLDDGWFKNRNDDTKALGDWYVDENKLPNGLSHLSKEIHKLGMKFGIWIEPEMVNEDSDLYREKPKWVIQAPNRSKSLGRNQLVLDFSNPDVVDYIEELLNNILSVVEIDYIKWDMNRNITEPYSLSLPSNQQGEFFHRYILGVYELYNRLTTKYPNILFESCASGGGRFDPGMLYYAPQAWTSDDTDAVERLKIQYGTSIAYPIKSMGSHISAIPNHQVIRNTSLKMRNDVALFGTYGFELDVNELSADEKEIIRQQIITFKRYQPILHFGDFYRLISPFESNDKNLVSWMCVDANKDNAIVGIYQILAVPNPGIVKIPLKGLSGDKLYYINELDLTCYGDELMNIGIILDGLFSGVGQDLEDALNYNKEKFGTGDFTSIIFTIEAINNQ